MNQCEKAIDSDITQEEIEELLVTWAIDPLSRPVTTDYALSYKDGAFWWCDKDKVARHKCQPEYAVSVIIAALTTRMLDLNCHMQRTDTYVYLGCMNGSSKVIGYSYRSALQCMARCVQHAVMFGGTAGSFSNNAKRASMATKCNCPDRVSMAGVVCYCPMCDDPVFGVFSRFANRRRARKEKRAAEKSKRGLEKEGKCGT